VPAAATTEPAFLVLTALVGSSRHGYGIVEEVERLSAGRTSLKVGTLYGVLDRLVKDGLVEFDREEVWQGRVRRYFRLTGTGEHHLATEAERLAAHARAASSRLAALPGRARPQAGGAA
jgi:PadR family transcriptional regulator, regulatory protein PadR